MNILNSVNDFNEAKQVIAGGVNSPVRAFGNTGLSPLFIKSGKGAYITDEDNNAYIDFVQSWGPLILGHADAVVLESVKNALENGLSFGAPTELETTLCKMIIGKIDCIDKLRLVNSGTEATMSAIRLGRAYSQKDDILKFDGCYHGHSDSLLVSAGSGCATFGAPSSPGVIEDLAKHTLVARYNDIESVKECFSKGDIGTVIIEPIAGNMGLVPADAEFLKELRKICDEFGAVLIFDEVMSGFRASEIGAYGVYGIDADLMTFGKVIGGGMPLAAFGGRAEIMNMLSPIGGVYQAGTLSGNPIATTCGVATLAQIFEDRGLYPRLGMLAQRFTSGLSEIASRYAIPLQTRYVGSMCGFFFNSVEVKNFDTAKKSNIALFNKFFALMLERGVYFACSQFETSFICKSMNEEIIDVVLQKADDAFKML